MNRLGVVRGRSVNVRVCLERIMLRVAYLGLVGALLGFVSLVVRATVPAGVETMFTDTATDFGTVVGYGWTLFLIIVGGLLLFGIVRRVLTRTVGR